jgi:hypothetical protein
MNLRSHLLSLGFLLASIAAASAEFPATNLPPGPLESPDLNQPQPATPAPPQPNAKSAPGAQAPNGTNGTTQSGMPVTKAPTSRHKKAGTPQAPALTAVASAPAKSLPPAPPILDAYLKELNDTLGLSATEKTEIESYYLTDAPKLNSLLNDPSLSPLQQEEQVSDLRDRRNEKIGALLEGVDRRHEFFKVEAVYRVALVDAAADGTLVPATPTPAAPAPSDIAPGEAEPIPTKNSGAK